ncbi:hypothetical protein EJ02DRAFT_504383 [Clathrospora elynae]|uniref:Uncharacterized protein n=1 Tax=Clathrospora elynae TaxID=706981 RepID=A0A6A5SSP5_9PLEO|nr:hypothetical protein EJ02DRAFT_504383 [Clathrospora elynae]
MQASRYAPKTPAENLAQSRAEKLKQDKERATRLLGRLRWKAEMLMVSYHRTMEIGQAAAQQNGYHEHHAMESGASSTNSIQKQAESMFKVDFFEFYTLLERFITDCLALLGFSVSAAAPLRNFNALRYETNPDLHRSRPMASHAFHANLLEALDDEKCPLHGSMGIQSVRVQLGLAKEYRNAWKDADAKANVSNGDTRANIQLQDLQLELMLRNLIGGCDLAHGVVQGHTNGTNGFTSRDFEPQSYVSTNMDMDDAPFEYMGDAMDLD